MAESGLYGSGFRLDVKQILLEAQNRWLRPAEICEILRYHEKFDVSPQPPNKPVSGSVFLFDRKVLRYFRKDGHNWRKKKDGKTIKEAHEKLKVGGIDMLHCYYSHGEDNENFQRRCYWLLEQDLMHIVFVHYLEVKGNKTNVSCIRNTGATAPHSENGMSLSSNFRGTSPTSTVSSAYEDAESEDSHQASSRFHSYPESPLTDNSHDALSNFNNLLPLPGNHLFTALNNTQLPWGTRDGEFSGGSFISGSQETLDLASWQEVYGHSIIGETANKQESGSSLPIQSYWQPPLEDPTMNRSWMLNLAHDPSNTLFEDKSLLPNQKNDAGTDEQKNLSEQSNLQMMLSDAEFGNVINSYLDNGMTTIGNENYSLFLKKPMICGLQAEENLKKVDSFSRWIAKELGEADELHMKSTNGSSWSIMGDEDDSNMQGQLHEYMEPLNPSISQDQLFSIIDFSPNWAYSNLKTKIVVTGTFLKRERELENCRWSIMFGEVEVPAEVLVDGFLCCHAPPHKPGLVPFYITSSNRLACSEVREFEFRFKTDQNEDVNDVNEHSVNVTDLHQRFEKLLCMGLIDGQVSSVENEFEQQNVVNNIILLMEEEKRQEANMASINGLPQLKVIGDRLLEKQLKKKFYNWLLRQVTVEGKGPAVVDERGQGVLHLAAALGFNWTFQPIMVSGVSLDFRDVHGWTALHWAAFYGREDTVATLVSLGAAPGALTDPTAEYPLCRTPADLASVSGHKGISGFLAETSLTAHLSSLGVNDQLEHRNSEVSGVKAIQTVSERLPVPTTEKDIPDTLSLKDSLAAVCNATLAAAHIHQIYRVHSFQRKQLSKHGCNELADEHAISLVTAKTCRLGHSDGMDNAAATHIQKKFRGWKKRKEFLLIRQKIVKIQAHVRGHQVRKKYKPIIWSVGILEKVILRWRRKGSGLRGFRSDGILKGPNTQSTLLREDDYDFLKQGRKQAEERMHKALARVKSMAQNPEARAQYRRLLTSAESYREIKQDSLDGIPNSIEDIIYPKEDLIDVQTLFDDDIFMSLAF